ncbi:GRAM domain-containing protein 1B [Drosophila serrata]|uniref:GRAM domain-containing protein 1B n=1 Tax=Drosophila serrata TaxID=7274 RepID=UPI000A1D132F|nr:GRAM domain-containing protein 1B [Drosophila serrata]
MSQHTSRNSATADLTGAFLQPRQSRNTRLTLQTAVKRTTNQTAQGTQTEKRKKKTYHRLRSTVLQSRETLLPIDKLRPEDLTARCSASHEGRKVLQERLPMLVDSLFNMIFSPSPFMEGFHERRKNTDLSMGCWTCDANGQNVRIVTVNVALQANIGPKKAKVIETQEMRDCSQPGQLYSIDVEIVNEDIPYADTFIVQVHYCLKATVEQHTDVQVFGQVKFLKPVWAVVKTFIEKNAYAGLEEFCQSLYCALLNEIKKM